MDKHRHNDDVSIKNVSIKNISIKNVNIKNVNFIQFYFTRTFDNCERLAMKYHIISFLNTALRIFTTIYWEWPVYEAHFTESQGQE